MSSTIAHRPHYQHQVPLTPVVVLIAAIAMAAVVIWLLNRPGTTSTAATTAVPAQIAAPASSVHTVRHAVRHGRAVTWSLTATTAGPAPAAAPASATQIARRLVRNGKGASWVAVRSASTAATTPVTSLRKAPHGRYGPAGVDNGGRGTAQSQPRSYAHNHASGTWGQ